MPINYAIVKNNLYNWAVSVVPVGMPVIFWEQNSPRPKIAYITLWLSSIIAINQDYSSPQANLNGDINMKGDRQFTLQINAYGNNTLTVLENIRSSLQKQTVLDTLRAGGIVFYQSLTINEISELVDSQFEERSQLDVLMAIGQTYTDNPGYFNEIEVQEVYENAIETVVYDDTIIITSP